jgi:hypothetical protein
MRRPRWAVAPVLDWTLRRPQHQVTERPESVWKEALADAPPLDQATLMQCQQIFQATLPEAFRQGIEGVREDVIAVAHPMGIRPP